MLVIHPGTLGDVLLAVPALRVLRSAFPQLELCLLCQAEVGSLLSECGEVDRVFELEGRFLGSLLAGHENLETPFRDFLGRCDVAVGWITDPDGVLAGLFTELGIPRVLVRSPHSPEFDGLHQTDRFLDSLGELASGIGGHRRLSLPKRLIEKGALLLGRGATTGKSPVVCLHPGSGSRHKCAHPSLFVEAIAWLQAHQAVPVLLGGPADRDQVACVRDHCSTPPAVLQDRDLLSMAGALASADLYLGHDSGLTHLAAALSVPTITLFGPTDQHRWAPRGPRVCTLTGPPCRCERWTTVQACGDKPCLQFSLQVLVERFQGFLESQSQGGVLSALQPGTRLVMADRVC